MGSAAAAEVTRMAGGEEEDERAKFLLGKVRGNMERERDWWEGVAAAVAGEAKKGAGTAMETGNGKGKSCVEWSSAVLSLRLTRVGAL